MSRPAAASLVLAAALASPAFAAQTPTPADPDRGFRCSWQDVVVRERAALPAADVVLERPYLTVHFTDGVFYPLEACGELVGLAWKGTGEVTVADPGPERGHRLNDRLETFPGTTTLEAALIIASDGAVDSLIEAAGGTWEETPLPLAVRAMVTARIKSFDPVDGRSGHPPGEILFAPEQRLGGLFVDLKSLDIKRSFQGRLDLPVTWISYHWSEHGRTAGEPGALYVREVGTDDSIPLAQLARPDILASDYPFGWQDAERDFDLVDVQAHVLFEPTAGLDRDLTDITAVARLEVQARVDGRRFVPLWLAEGRVRRYGEQYGALVVGGVRVNDAGARFDRSGDRLYVELPEPSREGETYVLEVRFSGGLVEPIGHDNITALSGPFLHPMGVSGDRFTFTSMVTAPKFCKVVATGRRIEELTDGRAITVTSRTRRPISTAVVFVIDARTETISPPREGLPVLRILRSPDTMAVNARMADQIYAHLDVLEGLLGPFPYDELEIVERPLSFSFTEVPGVISMPSFDPPPDQVITTRAGRVNLLQALARQHTSADMGPQSYHDAWLVEGLAVQAECYMLEAAGMPGRCAGALQSMRKAWMEMVANDPRALLGSVWMGASAGTRPMGAFSEPNSQARGPLVLHRLRLLLGDAANQQLIRRLATSYRGQRVSTRSFLIQAQAIAGVDLRSFFYGWVYATPQKPVLKLRWHTEKLDDGTWTLHLGGVIESGREGDPLPFVSPTMVHIRYGKADAWQRIVLTEVPADFTIAGIPEEPRKIDVDWQTFPGTVEVKKVP
jgi:hypothetical protein